MGVLFRVVEVWEKISFYGKLKGEWDVHSEDGLVMCLGEFNGHMGMHIDGVH